MSHEHHESESGLPFSEKLIKILEHWIRHNEDHVKTYMEWSLRAESHDADNVGSLIVQASEMTRKVNRLLEEALAAARQHADK